MSREVHVRPFTDADAETLNSYREQYWDADLEIPHGYMGQNIETVVTTKGENYIGSLTGTLSLTIDPFIKNPNASRLEIMQAVIKMEEVLAYMAQKLGAVDVYIAIPNQLVDTYGNILTKCGYEKTVEHCTVYRRPLIPDQRPYLGEIRNELLAQAQPAE